MQCPYCNNMVPLNVLQCPFCGAAVPQTQQPFTSQQPVGQQPIVVQVIQQPPAEAPKTENKTSNCCLGCLLIIGGLWFLCWVLGNI